MRDDLPNSTMDKGDGTMFDALIEANKPEKRMEDHEKNFNKRLDEFKEELEKVTRSLKTKKPRKKSDEDIEEEEDNEEENDDSDKQSEKDEEEDEEHEVEDHDEESDKEDEKEDEDENKAKKSSDNNSEDDDDHRYDGSKMVAKEIDSIDKRKNKVVEGEKEGKLQEEVVKHKRYTYTMGRQKQLAREQVSLGLLGRPKPSYTSDVKEKLAKARTITIQGNIAITSNKHRVKIMKKIHD